MGFYESKTIAVWTQHILGRVTGHKQTTDGQSYSTAYAYNLSGALVEQTYPSGRVVKNVIDNSGDLSQVQSKKNSGDFYRPYASNFAYNAAGAVTSMRLGNGKFETTVFNSRLQPIQIGLGSSVSDHGLLKLDYTYGTTNNNGNVLSQTITVPTVGANTGFVATQTYTYDTLNRIKDATENITPNGGSSSQSWKQTFTYDRYGNRNFDGEDGPINAGLNMPRQFVGSFTITITEKEDGDALFVLENTTHLKSLLYQIPGIQPITGGGPLSNKHQTFWWMEKGVVRR